MNLPKLAASPVWLVLLAFCAVASSLGCREPAPITQYTIDERVPDVLQDERRMLGAIVPQGDAVWFFKVMGPGKAVATVVEPVRQLVETVQFDGQGEPQMDPPERWKRLPASGMTFAKFDIPTDENLLQLTVTRLAKQGDWDASVMANVNRWRGQLGLDPSQEAWAGGEPFEVPAAGEEGAVWVDLTGEGDAAGGAAPPMMSGSSPPFANRSAMPPASPGPAPSPATAPPAATAPSSAAPAEELDYDLPEDWQVGRSGGMRIAAFEVGEGDGQAEVTLSRAGGDIEGNMKMWAGQVKLSEGAEAAVATSLEGAESLTVDGQPAQRFFIEGPGDQPRAIDVVVVESASPDTPQLFIKMSGPAATVREQAEAFGQFLASLKL